ncbi:putative FAD-linked oxidoreductase [Tritonibacter multivorans]|uniref:Putative FAD-linked oxidoreductase n=1 Tax=Tritonibacter multivorans TaxID=928856 RepID=A0A0P1G3G1_9RHOB|nr:FAD-binding protein [Tritonibacter multivorans]MDA7422548.1 FAD-binding protein [Tritonibacter multivorans]CUH76346.1 putative FAD-linked oxidoreductase [Tritonibacter multivorans]SFD39450.1 glycolate oxidase FAD binding subunit [Tritonibacter multivorans]
MLTPKTEAELAEMIAAAAGAIAIAGGGTRGVACEGAPLTTRGLTGVSLYEPGALTLVAGAGTPLAEVEALLAGENQRLAFEPADLRALLGTECMPTLGGVFATNGSGPRRIQCGAARDFLLGVRFVDGTGTVVSNGGRVMKNVTGYDLVKLMAGAHGTLGVLSEVSLKVLPRAETTTTVALSCGDLAVAVRAMSAALGAPYDVTGAAYDPQAGAAYVRLEGFEGSVAYRADKLAALLAVHGDVDIRPDSAELWQGLRDVAPLVGAEGDLWRISVKPGDAVQLVPALGAAQCLFDWGGGLVWAVVPKGTDLRARMAVPGHATLMRGSGFARFHPEPAPLAAISAGLRAKFDPRQILNPGLMG